MSADDGDRQVPPETPTGRPHRAGFVGIVGRPNVGKSTLMNQILGTKLAIATPKPQTTRDVIRGIQTWDDWQVAFVDTPGIHEARTKLNRHMVDLAFATLTDVDLAYLLIDAPKAAGRVDRWVETTGQIAERLAAAQTPTLLLVNKIDKLADKRDMLTVIEKLAPLHPFLDVVPLSARTGDGVEKLLELTRPRLPEGPPLFEADTLTDRSLRFIASELIREQVFMQLGQELPFHAAVSILDWKERPNGILAIHANVHVVKKSHKPIVVGKGGARIKQIGTRARMSIERLADRRVYLDLRVKVDEGWVDRPDALRALGYGGDELL